MAVKEKIRIRLQSYDAQLIDAAAEKDWGPPNPHPCACPPPPPPPPAATSPPSSLPPTKRR